MEHAQTARRPGPKVPPLIWTETVNRRGLSVILPVAVALIAIILALLLRSLVAPVYLVIAVLLGFAATGHR